MGDAEAQLWPLRTTFVRKHGIQQSLLPVEYATFIGALVVLWGQFEVEFDSLIDRLIQFNSSTVDPWRRLNFSKRKKLCRQQIKLAFGSYPGILREAGDLMSTASRLHVARNLLVHGVTASFIGEVGNYVVAIGRHNGRDIEAWFGYDQLAVLHMEIAEICTRPYDFTIGLSDDLSLPEKSILRAFAARTRPRPSIRHRSSPPPQSFRG